MAGRQNNPTLTAGAVALGENTTALVTELFSKDPSTLSLSAREKLGDELYNVSSQEGFVAIASSENGAYSRSKTK